MDPNYNTQSILDNIVIGGIAIGLIMILIMLIYCIYGGTDRTDRTDRTKDKRRFYDVTIKID